MVLQLFLWETVLCGINPLSSLFLRFACTGLVGFSVGVGRVYSSFYADFLSLSLPAWDNMIHFNMSFIDGMCYNMVVIVLFHSLTVI